MSINVTWTIADNDIHTFEGVVEGRPNITLYAGYNPDGCTLYYGHSMIETVAKAIDTSGMTAAHRNNYIAKCVSNAKAKAEASLAAELAKFGQEA